MTRVRLRVDRILRDSPVPQRGLHVNALSRYRMDAVGSLLRTRSLGRWACGPRSEHSIAKSQKPH